MPPACASRSEPTATGPGVRTTRWSTWEAGKSADFIVLDANPLDDIANTRRIAAVYLRGEAVDRTPVR